MNTKPTIVAGAYCLALSIGSITHHTPHLDPVEVPTPATPQPVLHAHVVSAITNTAEGGDFVAIEYIHRLVATHMGVVVLPRG
jgi:hypothetical protein